MKLSGVFCTFCTVVLASNIAFASDIEVAGTLHHTVPVQEPLLSNQTDADFSAPEPYKQITLLKINLSEKAQKTFQKRVAQVKSESLDRGKPHKTGVQLGMNNVPVLDQGVHGTCVTFANTAAIDAVLNKGDYISQLCQLQLGQHFENQAYSASGWDGSLGPVVLSQISLFGVVNKNNQKTVGCGGVTEYPLEDAAPATEISVPEFHQISEPVVNVAMAWSPVLDIFQAVLGETDTVKTLDHVKKALQEGDRVTFGVLLADLQLGVAGAVGKYRAENDAWILTQKIKDDIQSGMADFGGHEMIITGYDDNAVAVDEKGRKYRGLLTLRNSWGDTIGDKGEFYMSYEYFKALVIEAQRIRSFKL